MKNWNLLAEALELHIPEAGMARVSAPLDALEAAFRPLASSIPLETEPAYLVGCPSEEAE